MVSVNIPVAIKLVNVLGPFFWKIGFTKTASKLFDVNKYEGTISLEEIAVR